MLLVRVGAQLPLSMLCATFSDLDRDWTQARSTLTSDIWSQPFKSQCIKQCAYGKLWRGNQKSAKLAFKSSRSWPKVTSKVIPNQPEVSLKSVPEWPKVSPQSAPCRLAQSHPRGEGGPKPGQDQPKVSVRMAQCPSDLHGTFMGSASSGPCPWRGLSFSPWTNETRMSLSLHGQDGLISTIHSNLWCTSQAESKQMSWNCSMLALNACGCICSLTLKWYGLVSSQCFEPSMLPHTYGDSHCPGCG